MKSNIDNIVKPKAGDPITESMLTSIIDSIDALKSRLSADNSPEYVNPAIVRCINGLNGELPIFSVVHLGNATITDRSFFNSSGGATQDARIRATQPTGAEDEPFGVIRSAVGPGFEVSAVCSGFTCCKIKVENTQQEQYKYAKPVKNVTEYFQAAESGPCLIVWKESGIGVKWAYVIIDRSDSVAPLQVAAEMVNTDTRPEGAFKLPTTGTWLYADAIDSIAKKDDSNPPAIANPCGYPEDRPVIIGKCTGFNGIEKEEEETTGGTSSGNSSSGSSSSSSISSPEPEAVAIACDTREFFMINNNSSSSGSSSSSGNSSSSGGSGGTTYNKGSLVYIDYQNGRWVPTDRYTDRLAVCQRDMPSGWNKEFRMPYYTPEQNYGVKPKRDSSSTGSTGSSSSSSSSSSSTVTGERCGVASGEHEFSNKRLDYHYANGRYSYEPRFIFIGEAKAGTGTGSVSIEIEGQDYGVTFPNPRSATSYPDIYAGDKITVEVDARSEEPILTAIDYPMDFPENTIIMTHSGLPGRGWEDVTDSTNSGDRSGADLLVLDWSSNKILANYTTHICTCSGGSSSSGGGGGGGHTCPHTAITTAKTTARWYKKVKTNALK